LNPIPSPFLDGISQQNNFPESLPAKKALSSFFHLSRVGVELMDILSMGSPSPFLSNFQIAIDPSFAPDANNELLLAKLRQLIGSL
jgi:hypothetical protein